MVETRNRVRGADGSGIGTLAARRSDVETVLPQAFGRRRQVGHFVLHYFEMCVPVEELGTYLHRVQEVLKRRGVPAFIRISRGRDVMAACGQLSLVGG